MRKNTKIKYLIKIDFYSSALCFALKCEDKCIGEKERIFEEYKAVLPAIIKRETEEGMCGVLD